VHDLGPDSGAFAGNTACVTVLAAHERERRPDRRGLAAYVLGWLAAGAAVAALVIALVSGGGDGARPASSHAGAPPVREVTLDDAVRSAGCRVRAVATGAAGAARAPRAGIRRDGLTAGARDAAVRRGLVVIEYPPAVRGAAYERLEGVQRAVPNATILAPATGLGRDELTVSTLGRRLSCPTDGRATLDAVQLFRGRYLGAKAPSSAG
jgi:hypothetical protein